MSSNTRRWLRGVISRQCCAGGRRKRTKAAQAVPVARAPVHQVQGSDITVAPSLGDGDGDDYCCLQAISGEP